MKCNKMKCNNKRLLDKNLQSVWLHLQEKVQQILCSIERKESVF